MTQTAFNPADQQAQVFQQSFQQIQANIERIIVGKSTAVRHALVCLFAEGHLLIEDVPGTGKTSLAKAVADSVEGRCNRIQFTPDLLPADITGATIFNQGNGTFEFHPGPIFANIVLGDEINRASPKTQSALLEVMEEQQVTVEGTAYAVARPFMVIATQNPIEFEGTYHLPEAQLDRFLMRISIGQLDAETEFQMLRRHGGPRVGGLPPVLTSSQVRAMVALAEQINVDASIHRYIVSVAHGTRSLPEVKLGASSRACLALLRASRVHAAAEGRSFVRPDDVKVLAGPVLEHRLVLTPEAEMRSVSPRDLVLRVLNDVVPPTRRAG